MKLLIILLSLSVYSHLKCADDPDSEVRKILLPITRINVFQEFKGTIINSIAQLKKNQKEAICKIFPIFKEKAKECFSKKDYEGLAKFRHELDSKDLDYFFLQLQMAFILLNEQNESEESLINFLNSIEKIVNE